MAKKTQIEKFRETARALESDEDEDKFDAALRRVATHRDSGDRESKKPSEKKKKR
jgi:hypothetical protein